jgi:hypothetical protein
MNIDKLKSSGKILLIMLFAYGIMNVMSEEVFIAGTPQIRPNLDKHLAYRWSELTRGNVQFIAEMFDNRTPEQKLENVPLHELTKGVYAKGEKNYSYTVIKKGEVEWIEYTFNVNGKEVKIKVPKGEQPPAQEMVENIYK